MPARPCARRRAQGELGHQLARQRPQVAGLGLGQAVRPGHVVDHTQLALRRVAADRETALRAARATEERYRLAARATNDDT
jgi:hypothetical protein